MLYRGPSPLPKLCGELTATFQLTAADAMAFSALCELDATLTIPDMCQAPGYCNGATQSYKLMPNVNSITFTQLQLTASISPDQEVISGSSRFELATGSSDCANPDTDAACLTSDLQFSVCTKGQTQSCH